MLLAERPTWTGSRRWVRRELARDPKTKVEVLWKLARDEDAQVRIALVEI